MEETAVEGAEEIHLVGEETDSKTTDDEKIDLAKEDIENYNKQIKGWVPKENKKNKKEM